MVSLFIALTNWNLLTWGIYYSVTMIYIVFYIHYSPLKSETSFYLLVLNQKLVCLFLFFALWCTDYVQNEKFYSICASCMVYLFYIGITLNMGVACVVILADALIKAKKLYYLRNVERLREKMHRNRFHSGYKQN